MRIASTQYHVTMNTALQKATARLGTMLQKLASGRRFLLPSEDPISAVRLSRMTREDATITQFRDNIAALRNRLTQTESHLRGMIDDMLNARDLVVWASDGGNTSADVAAIAQALRPVIDSLFFTSNTRDAEGRYVFSGTAIDTPALTYDPMAPVGSRYTFTGNTVQQRVAVGNGATQAANVVLPELATLLNVLERALVTLSTPGVNVNDPAVRADLEAALTGLDDAIGSVSVRVSQLGGTQTILETFDNTHANVGLANHQAALTVGQLDYADAMVKLNGYTAAIQATQKAYSEVSKLSLFDVM